VDVVRCLGLYQFKVASWKRICLPADSWTSEVLGSAFRSCSDFSAAFRSSVFLRFESWMRLPNSAARICAVIVGGPAWESSYAP
jgi:hypothetical protein